MKIENPSADVRHGDELIDLMTECQPSSPEEAGVHYDAYDGAARFDAAFYEPAKARAETDMTFDLVKLEGVFIPAIDDFYAAMDKATDGIRDAHSEAVRRCDPQIVSDKLGVARDNMSAALAYTTILSEYGVDPDVLFDGPTFMYLVRSPQGPYCASDVYTAGRRCVEAAQKTVLDQYSRIARDGRLIDREKALVDGALHALKTNQLTACRDFIEMMNEDRDLISEMILYSDQIRHDVEVLRRSSQYVGILTDALTSLVRPMPKPEGWAA